VTIDTNINIGNLLTLGGIVVSLIWQLVSIRSQVDSMKSKIESMQTSMEERVDSLDRHLGERISLAERAHQQLATSYGLMIGMVDRHDVYVGLIVAKCLGKDVTREQMCPSEMCPSETRPTSIGASRSQGMHITIPAPPVLHEDLHMAADVMPPHE